MSILCTYPEIADEYCQFVTEESAPGSNKPGSYVRAIHILNAVLNEKRPELLGHTHNLWTLTDISQLNLIRKTVLAEVKKINGGIFAGVEPRSYWENNYCSAALGSLISFQSCALRKKDMLFIIQRATNSIALARELENFSLEIKADKQEILGIPLDTLEGRDRLVIQKARENQHKFRTLVLWNYRSQCCISGFPIAHCLEASHIKDWSEDVSLRLNASNGLCLAAHYHSAFDNHLITLDEQYRLVLSKTLQEYVSNKAFQEQFKKYEGKTIFMPQRFNPSQELLAIHREQLVG